VKVHQPAQHLFIDSDSVIEGRDDRQQNSANHVFPPFVILVTAQLPDRSFEARALPEISKIHAKP
jgi:hypothetical protein